MATRRTFSRMQDIRTQAEEQSLTVEHRCDNPEYVAIYRTYSSHHDAQGCYHVILAWRIVFVFSANLAYITEFNTVSNEAPLPLSSLLLRIKMANRLGPWTLPKDTRRASDGELQAVWKDIKTRKRIS